MKKDEATKEQGVGNATELHIDEIALKKGHSQFETLLYTQGKVVDTMPGKKSEDLQEILKSIPGIQQIKRVCMDMCTAFREAVQKVLPQAEVVCDRFHIVKLLNKKLDKLRIKQYRTLNEAKRRRFSHIRFLLFKNESELNRDERRLVREYLRFNGEMKEIYRLTQEFRGILLTSQGKRHSDVSNTLMEWTQRAKKHLAKFVKTLETWWNEVVNACIFPLSNARAEGMNNKIKLLKRSAFGFRSRQNFRLHIKAIFPT